MDHRIRFLGWRCRWAASAIGRALWSLVASVVLDPDVPVPRSKNARTAAALLSTLSSRDVRPASESAWARLGRHLHAGQVDGDCSMTEDRELVLWSPGADEDGWRQLLFERERSSVVWTRRVGVRRVVVVLALDELDAPGEVWLLGRRDNRALAALRDR